MFVDETFKRLFSHAGVIRCAIIDREAGRIVHARGSKCINKSDFIASVASLLTNTASFSLKNDEDICKKIQNIADTDEEHKRFHAKHSYRGEAITDLPKRWGTNDYLVRSGRIGEGKIFKERYASLVDDKFHEVLVYKTKMSENGTISGIAIPYMG